jgi:two-component system sensor histidine kinase CpxA
LFWKIFFWFWGTMLLIGLTLYLVVLTTPPDPMPRPWRETAGHLLASYAAQSAAHWEKDGRAATNAYFDFLERDTQGHFWLYDGTGRELSGRPIPPLIPSSQLLPPPPGRDPRNSPRKRVPVETALRLREIAHRAAARNAAVFQFVPPRVLVGQRVLSPAGRSYVLVGSLARPAFPRAIAGPRRQLIGLLALAALSTLVCYALARSLTAPILTLRRATQRLAGGELSTRVASHIEKRRDEIADLARDFDAMAERIELLLTSQRRLLGDVSHELRSPLARLSMALGLARHHAASGAGIELDAALDRIAREKERLNELIGQLLELVRLESGEGAEPPEKIDLAALVREIAEDADFEAQAMQRHVHITRADACFINGSRELLRRAVENVVRNAVAYTAPETSVEIGLERGDACGCVRVRDHGPGVPEAALEKLFQPFYRVAEARDRQSGGVGLGLAITERAVRSHGGSVIAVNAPGGGLRIELCLPITDAPIADVPFTDAAA